MNIIIQAGGRGSRLRHLTWNKPKCLVSFDGEPILFKLFKKFSGNKFYVIGDYHFDVLKNYIELNASEHDVTVIKASGNGTTSGIAQAMDIIDDNNPCLILWSDLIIGKSQDLKNITNPTIFTTDDFVCRWSVVNGRLVEKTSSSEGVAGIFYLPSVESMPRPPKSGEFVRWLSTINNVNFDFVNWPNLSEMGDFHKIEEKNEISNFARFFNNLKITNEIVIKTNRVKEYQNLIDREINWYKAISNLGFKRIPKLIEETPFTLQKIDGDHAFNMLDLSEREKGTVIINVIDSLKEMHSLESIPSKHQDFENVYKDKTINRVNSICKLIPNFNSKTFTINGEKCRNFFAEDVEEIFSEFLNNITSRQYQSIHGDPTLSNIIVDKYLRPWFIDPRGYFVKEGVHGDPLYDFAKLYYSTVGGYDSINRKKFKIYINSNVIEVLYDKPILCDKAEAIFKAEFDTRELREIKIIHALIWYALSGYAKDDIDTILAAFYLGTYWMNKAL